jgi:hypothetical protein
MRSANAPPVTANDASQAARRGNGAGRAPAHGSHEERHRERRNGDEHRIQRERLGAVHLPVGVAIAASDERV